MLQSETKSAFKYRVKYDKPINQKDSKDFDDSDIDLSFTSYNSNNSINKEVENSQKTLKNNKNFLKNSLNNATFTFQEQEDYKINKNFNISFKNKKINNKSDNNIDNNNMSNNDYLYSDKEDSDKNSDENTEEARERKKNKKIEKQLILSITNKEAVTRERIYLAESIRFKDVPDSIIITDEYGFVQNDDNNNSLSLKNSIKTSERLSKKLYKSKSGKDLLKINARIEKWKYMIDHYEEFSTKKIKTLKSRTRKGIPDSLRGYVWQLFAEKKKYYIKDLYKDLQSQPINEELEKIIIKDLDRTFPLCQFFKEKYGNGQRKLYKILSSYSIYNKDVGYLQGMGFLTAVFLTYMDEESSFFMLHSLMKKYQMDSIFFDGFPGLKKKFFIMLKLQKKCIPKIYKIFQRDGILPTMYLSTWFISLFARSIEFHIVIRIFDCFFLEGFKVIYRISLALLKLKENEFCKCSIGNALSLLQTCVDNINIDELFKIAFGFSISRKYINKCEEEYEKVKNDEKNEFISQICW